MGRTLKYYPSVAFFLPSVVSVAVGCPGKVLGSLWNLRSLKSLRSLRSLGSVRSFGSLGSLRNFGINVGSALPIFSKFPSLSKLSNLSKLTTCALCSSLYALCSLPPSDPRKFPQLRRYFLNSCIKIECYA